MTWTWWIRSRVDWGARNMAKNKRVNPRRRPVTMATVNKMREDVKEEAVSLAIAIFSYGFV